MTYNTDPSRWTDSLAEAPEALRAPFAAARNEGPSDLQMKALALKLAALSAGTAAAATAATAKAAATTTAGGGAAMASAGTFSVAKIAISVALFGATITGAVVWQQGKVSVRQGAQAPAVVEQARQAPRTQLSEGQPAAQQLQGVRIGTNSAAAPVVAAPAVTAPEAAPVPSRVVEHAAAKPQSQGVAAKAQVTSPADEAPSAARALSAPASTRSTGHSRAAVQQQAPAAKSGAVAANASPAKSTEVDLLRSARAALARRPREAFAITQEHRELYPNGMFAQERDALAIEALMRAGEMSTARALAERFVREHPSSPHAHRFRETMDLR